MKKTRLEAFSDGVLAIVITLLILDVKLPAVAYENLYGSLLKILPAVGVYMLSFLLIGMYLGVSSFCFLRLFAKWMACCFGSTYCSWVSVFCHSLPACLGGILFMP